MKTFFSVFLFLFTIVGFSQQTKVNWSLEDCIDYATKNNISIKKGELKQQLDEVELTRAKADFLPSIDGNIGATYHFGGNKTSNPLTTNNNSFTNNFGISSNAILYNGNNKKNNVLMTEKSIEISELGIAITKDNITLSVINAYLNVLYNRESISIAEDKMDVGIKLVERMQELVDAGTKARSDLFQVEANLVSDEESLVKAKNNYDLSLLDLTQLLQISYKGFDIAPVVVDINKAKLFYKDSEIIFEKALTWRPEIESARKNIEYTDIGISKAESSKLPIVSASYSFGTNFLDITNVVGESSYSDQLWENRGHSVGVSIGIPIFDKWVTKTNVQRSKIQKEIAEYSLEDEKTNLRAAIERAFIDAKTSLKTYEASKKSVKAQEEAFRTAKERYELGVLTSYDFDQVNNQLVNAKSAFVRAKYNYIFRTKFLEFYYGLPIKL